MTHILAFLFSAPVLSIAIIGILGFRSSMSDTSNL
jgi:hypothetical protein